MPRPLPVHGTMPEPATRPPLAIAAKGFRPFFLLAARHPLLWILHVGYAWIAVGLLLRALPAVGVPVWSSIATHALTVGAIAALTLGMMARVALGHTGRLPRSRASACRSSRCAGTSSRSSSPARCGRSRS